MTPSPMPAAAASAAAKRCDEVLCVGALRLCTSAAADWRDGGRVPYPDMRLRRCVLVR